MNSKEARKHEIQRIQKTLNNKNHEYRGPTYFKEEQDLFKETDNRGWCSPGRMTGIKGSEVKSIYTKCNKAVPASNIMPSTEEVEETEYEIAEKEDGEKQ